MGRFIDHVNCEECGSSDGLALYQQEDGSVDGFCWVCKHYHPDPTGTGSGSFRETEITTRIPIESLPILALADRGISKEAAEHFGVRVELSETNGEVVAHYYPYTKRGRITGWKRRDIVTTDRKRRFLSIGDRKECELFGQNVAGSGGRMIVVTEGECDALAAWDLFRKKGKVYRVVSLPDGANVNAIQQQLEWLETFETVILCFDQDEPGQTAAKQAAELLTPGKARIMSFSEKDANDMLRENKVNEFFAALSNAAETRPDGIVSGKDTWELIKNRELVPSVPFPEDWTEMNRMTYGMRIGELDTFTSGSGMGKTQLMRELEYHLLRNTQDSIGIIKLEEPLHDSVEALMGLHLNKRIHLPDVRETLTEEELYSAWLATSGTNRLHYYDHFGSVDEQSLLAKIRFLAKGLNCKYVFLDHLSIAISEFAEEGGERERIDTLMTRLKKLTQELSIWIGLVVHLRKTGGGTPFEEGGVPTLDDLRGSGSIKQLSNSVYALSRNQQEEDEVRRNTSHLHVLKCRFTGRTGPADFLYFDQETGRMVSIGNPANQPDQIGGF